MLRVAQLERQGQGCIPGTGLVQARLSPHPPGFRMPDYTLSSLRGGRGRPAAPAPDAPPPVCNTARPAPAHRALRGGAHPGKRPLTFPKSRTSKRSKGSNSSLFLSPNLSWQTLRKVRMFFKHRN